MNGTATKHFFDLESVCVMAVSAGSFTALFITVDFWLKLAIGLSSLVYLLLKIRNAWRHSRIEDCEEASSQANLCASCQAGRVPVVCPIARGRRPLSCPRHDL
jgi:hypothetical protein